jgi:hypothetical protein
MKKLDLLVLAGVMAAAPMVTTYGQPDGWIPMWLDDKSQTETAIINTANIVSVHPVFDAETAFSRKPVVNYLDVYLSDGRHLTVTEDYEEFKKRIRNSR